MSVEIFIGSLIEHGSERAVLERAVNILRTEGEPAIILANINLLGRQIDFVIVLEHLTLVIEAKSYSLPVRGTENGAWQYRIASGWTNFSGTNNNLSSPLGLYQ